ncbi:hypothetical protein Nizo2484_1929 [Lactiplantibacillus plantarum]|nr:hypothetical protein Nizo2484_1929 [Lactiplantibacillus plantarum]KZU27398.1 hypothetical protein Nizo2485_1395 [Lactiplantibacillus plantarum]
MSIDSVAAAIDTTPVFLKYILTCNLLAGKPVIVILVNLLFTKTAPQSGHVFNNRLWALVVLN